LPFLNASRSETEISKQARKRIFRGNRVLEQTQTNAYSLLWQYVIFSIQRFGASRLKFRLPAAL
jgi:hypothetical protein